MTGAMVGIGLGVGVVGGGTMQMSLPNLSIEVTRAIWQTHSVNGSWKKIYQIYILCIAKKTN